MEKKREKKKRIGNFERVIHVFTAYRLVNNNFFFFFFFKKKKAIIRKKIKSIWGSPYDQGDIYPTRLTTLLLRKMIELNNKT